MGGSEILVLIYNTRARPSALPQKNWLTTSVRVLPEQKHQVLAHYLQMDRTVYLWFEVLPPV